MTTATRTRAYPQPEVKAGSFVAVSKISVDATSAGQLEAAFRNRLGEVDAWPGFRDLQVWRDSGDPELYVMVSWWDTREQFKAYMKSESHARSHARIPRGPGAPRPAGLSYFEVIAV